MGFSDFLVLVVLSAVISWVFHFGFSYYAVPGWRSFFGKMVIGYFGAVMAGSFIGHWDLGFRISAVPVIPAVLGSVVMIVFAVDVYETFAGKKVV